jgi:hypothetical protein
LSQQFALVADHGGAQERSVPTRNGCVVEAPAGRQRIQAGATAVAAGDAVAVGDAAAEGVPPLGVRPVVARPPTRGSAAGDDRRPLPEAVAAVCAAAGPATAATSDTATNNRMADNRSISFT